MKKHIFDKTKIKALLLSGVTLLSGVSCGKTNTQKEQPQSAILMETETTKNNNTVTTTEKNAKQESTSNNYNNTNDNYTEYENTNTQEEQMAPTEAYTEGHTEGHTEAQYSKIVTDKYELPSIGGHKVKSEQPQTTNNSSERTRIVTNITTKKTTQPTTKKTTQTTTRTTTQTTTTAKPVTQATVATTAAPVVNYDFSIDNITKSADVFNKFADSMAAEIQRGSRIELPDCNAERYWMYGNTEARVALLLLNMNEPYENGVLSEVFNGYGDYEIKNGILYLYRMAMIEEVTEVNIDWRDYTKDQATADYMNRLMQAAKNARENNDFDELNTMLKSFMDGNYSNSGAGLLTIGYGDRISGNQYEDTYSALSSYMFEIYGYQDKVNELIR